MVVRGDTRAKCLLVDDHALLAMGLRSFFTLGEIRTHWVSTNHDAVSYLRQGLLDSNALDVIVTDISHPGPDGVHLVRELRSLSDDVLLPGGLRARYVPVVVLSASLTESRRSAMAAIDPKVPLIPKSVAQEVLLPAIDRVLSEYRHAVLQELERIGLGVAWQDGRYEILGAYRQKPRCSVEGSLFAGSPTNVAAGYGRLLLVADRISAADRSVTELEALLNDSRTSEADLHAFFERHPEFLLGDTFDSYWSRPTLSRSKGSPLRPDFVLQPGALRDVPWNWRVIELKRPQPPVVAGSHFHPAFSHHVHRAAAQLRDYGEFFADPRNAAVLRRRFGGVVPRPQLVLLIGRLPSKDRARLASLRERAPDIEVTTYDEVLEFRRVRVGHRRSLGIG